MNEPAGAPRIAVVVAAFDAARTIGPTVAACRAQDSAEPLEIVVVDDGSTDATAAIAEREGARVVRQENAGPASARNRGWREARAPVILFTDSDCVPRTDWARRLAGALDAAHPVVCGSYGIANPGSALARMSHAEIRWRHARLPETVEFAGSYNFGATRAALESVGGFDETYRAPSGEDNDLSYRLRDAGHRIRFVREALVDHHHTASLGKYLREQARHGRWRAALYATHPGRAAGDGYAGGLDFLAPPLARVGAAAAVLSPAVSTARPVAAGALAVVLAVHVVLALRVALFARAAAPLLLAPVGVLRAFARGVGLARGITDVLSRRKR